MTWVTGHQDLVIQYRKHHQLICRLHLLTAPPVNLPAGAKEHEINRGDTVVRIAHMYDVPTCNVVTTDGKLPDLVHCDKHCDKQPGDCAFVEVEDAMNGNAKVTYKTIRHMKGSCKRLRL